LLRADSEKTSLKSLLIVSQGKMASLQPKRRRVSEKPMNQSIDNSKISILITDDNAVCVRALESILKDSGYKILTAFCGKECIEKTREFRPDLILLDIVME